MVIFARFRASTVTRTGTFVALWITSTVTRTGTFVALWRCANFTSEGDLINVSGGRAETLFVDPYLAALGQSLNAPKNGSAVKTRPPSDLINRGPAGRPVPRDPKQDFTRRAFAFGSLEDQGHRVEAV